MNPFDRIKEQIDEDLHVIVIGHKADEVAKSISQVPNVKKVIHVDNEIYENFLAENFTSVKAST